MNAVDPRTLEMLGKNASQLASNRSGGMTDAVVEAIGDKKLNEQQIRRVVEHANIDMFNTKFSEIQGTVRSVHFEGGPADPVEVLQKLNNAARPQEVMMTPSDYSTAPDFSKSSSAEPESDGKTAEHCIQEVLELRTKLALARDALAAGRDTAEIQSLSSIDPVLESIKSASAAGASSSEVYEALCATNKAAAEVLFPQIRHLIDEKNEKVASREISQNSRLVQTFASFAKAASEVIEYSNELNEVLEGIAQVDEWLKEASAAREFGENLARGAKGLINGGRAVVRGAGDVGAGLAKGLGAHETVGRAAGLTALGGAGYIGATKAKNKAEQIKFDLLYGNQGQGQYYY